MRTWTLLATGLFAAAMLVPGTAAQAQLPGVELVFEEPAGPVPYDGTTELNFTATIGCLGILTSSGSTDLEVTTDGAPAYLGIQNKTVSFDEADCVAGSGVLTITDSLSMTPTSEAPGLSTTEVTIVAAHGDASDSSTIPITVDYKMGYTWATNITFPYEMTGESVTFDLTLTVDTNAVTMVMFESVTAPLGILPAPFPYTFNDPMANSTHTVQITYQAPLGDWTNDTAVIKTWSHYLNDGAVKTADEEMTFTFTRAAGAASGGDDGKDSPGVALPVMLALLGAAMVVARRRS